MKILTWTQFLREYFLQRSCKSQHRSDSPAGKEIFRFLDSHPGKEISRAEACLGNYPRVLVFLLWSQLLSIAMYQQRFLQNSHVWSLNTPLFDTRNVYQLRFPFFNQICICHTRTVYP